MGTPVGPSRARRAMTLIEIVVVIAVLGLIALVSMPALNALFDLRQRAAARELAQTYTWLIDEASLRNATFRVAFNLDEGSWQVEVGEPDMVILQTPEERIRHEQEQRDKLKRYTQRELQEGRGPEDAETSRFEGLTDPSFTTSQKLPEGTRFAWVWTPQYGEQGQRPREGEAREDEGPTMAYSHVFRDGTAEHTLIRIESVDSPEDGFTVEVLPVSGQVRMVTERIEPGQSLAWLPREAPGLR